jgi:hypothetical protein
VLAPYFRAENWILPGDKERAIAAWMEHFAATPPRYERMEFNLGPLAALPRAYVWIDLGGQRHFRLGFGCLLLLF